MWRFTTRSAVINKNVVFSHSFLLLRAHVFIFSSIQAGPNTWPITLVSYVYIRKDLSFIEDAANRQLLKAFAKTLFDENYIGMCDRYGLIPVPTALKELSLAGIDMLEMNDENNAHEFIWEATDTLPGIGQGDYVLSDRRESFTLYEADRLADDVADMAAEISQLKLELATMRASVSESSGASSIFNPSVVLGLGAVAATMLFGL